MKKLRTFLPEMPSLRKGVPIMIVLTLGMTACYYDNEETLYPGTCNTNDITYGVYVKSFVDINCSCHVRGSKDGNINLEGYTEIKKLADDGRLLKVLKHQSGVSPMPPSVPRRSACDISKIESWILAGSKNN